MVRSVYCCRWIEKANKQTNCTIYIGQWAVHTESTLTNSFCGNVILLNYNCVRPLVTSFAMDKSLNGCWLYYMRRNLLIVILFQPLFTLNLNLCTRLPAKNPRSHLLSIYRLLYPSHPTKRFIEHNNRIIQTKVDGLLNEITLNIATVCMLCSAKCVVYDSTICLPFCCWCKFSIRCFPTRLYSFATAKPLFAKTRHETDFVYIRTWFEHFVLLANLKTYTLCSHTNETNTWT